MENNLIQEEELEEVRKVEEEEKRRERREIQRIVTKEGRGWEDKKDFEWPDGCGPSDEEFWPRTKAVNEKHMKELERKKREKEKKVERERRMMKVEEEIKEEKYKG